LTEIGYIDQEIDDWFHGRNEEFVRSLEANYERALHVDDDDVESYFPPIYGLTKIVYGGGTIAFLWGVDEDGGGVSNIRGERSL
jgi:hypothetical protein